MANNASYTAYSIPDVMFKDSGGAKGIGWLQTETSAPGFAMTRGLGTSKLAGADYLSAHLGVATATQGSPIGNGHPISLAGATYIENPNGASTVRSGRARNIYASEAGELFTTGAPLAPSLLLGSGSRDTIKTSSGIIFSCMISAASCNKGDTVTIMDQLKTIATYVIGANHFSGNNGVYETGSFPIPRSGWRIGSGGATGTSIAIVRSIAAGNASIVVTYR